MKNSPHYQPTDAEQRHAKKIGARFYAALAKATLIVHKRRELVGADMTRSTIAWKAALRATGYPIPGMIFPRDQLQIKEMQEIADQVWAEAVDGCIEREAV